MFRINLGNKMFMKSIGISTSPSTVWKQKDQKFEALSQKKKKIKTDSNINFTPNFASKPHFYPFLQSWNQRLGCISVDRVLAKHARGSGFDSPEPNKVAR